MPHPCRCYVHEQGIHALSGRPRLYVGGLKDCHLVPAAGEELQAKLDAVITEQDSRSRLAGT